MPIRQCQQCGCNFSPRKEGQIFCSSKCKALGGCKTTKLPQVKPLPAPPALEPVEDEDFEWLNRKLEDAVALNRMLLKANMALKKQRDSIQAKSDREIAQLKKTIDELRELNSKGFDLEKWREDERRTQAH